MPALIPALVAAMMQVLRVLLMAKIGAFIVSALAFFGFTFVVNQYAIEPALSALTGYVSQLGAGGGAMGHAMQWAGVLKFDQAISVIISAYTVAWTIKSAKVWLGKTS